MKAIYEAYKKSEKEATNFVRKQHEYQLLDADDDKEEEAMQEMAKNKEKKERKHRKGLQRKWEEVVDEDEEVFITRG